MGYFSNGSEGDRYEARYCHRCINWRDKHDGRGAGCPVWDIHFVYNYDQFPEHAKTDAARSHAATIRAILASLIPMPEGCSSNAECRMFRAREG